MCALLHVVKYYFSAMKKLLLILLSIIASTAFAQQLFPIKVKSKWGYTNVAGKLVIQATYDYAEYFFEGRAVVALNNQPCVINEQNVRIIDTGLYISIQRYSEGLARVTDVKLKQFYVDLSGKVIFELKGNYYDARPFKNGLAGVTRNVELHETKFNRDIVTLGYLFGYINKNGEEVVPCKYDDADDYANGLARVKLNGKFGYIDTDGKEVIALKYKNLGKFMEGKAVVEVNGKYGFIDTLGNEIIKPVYDYAFDYSEGVAAVMMEGKYGFIDATGKLIINPQYQTVRPFSDGMAAVKIENKWGFIDATGKLVLRPVFDDATLFVEQRCPVLLKRKWGFIDKSGRLVIPAEFDAVGTFSNGLAEVNIGQVEVYVNHSGIIIPQLR
jgi:hypothetical protein